MRGRNVFMGYLGAEERTREVFDADGWHHSGDVGTVDEDGFYVITGRIKEILITAGGENVPPVIIEDMVSGTRVLRDKLTLILTEDNMEQFKCKNVVKRAKSILLNFQVKKELPCLSNVVLIGDRRKFLSCLVTLKTEVMT